MGIIILSLTKVYLKLRFYYLTNIGTFLGYIVKASFDANLPKPELSENLEFPCKFSTPRSENVPQSVHKLRPGDIDLIGVIGDSLTAGTSVSATNLLELPAEERGASFAGGGADTWRTRLTLPNILKEFNPRLSGYATGTSLYIEKAAGLNFAEPAAFSSDMFTFIQLLVQRIMNDPTVDFRKDWKMITIMMGHNDFCTANCNLKNPYDALIMHAKDLVKVLRFIRDNLPRSIVNIVPPYDTRLAAGLKDKPYFCDFMHTFYCQCLLGLRFKSKQSVFGDIIKKWQKLDVMIADLPEFDLEDFTVIAHNFTIGYEVPKTSDGGTDYSLFAVDCFHFSPSGHARAATDLWNSLMGTSYGRKTVDIDGNKLICPTEEHPYICTKRNSRQCNVAMNKIMN